MNKIKLLLLVIITSVLLSQCQNAENNNFRVGVIIPLTGPVATYGQDLKKGIDIAFETESDFNVFYEDDKANAAVGITAMKKLHDFDKINYFIGCATTTVSIAIAEEAQKQQSLLVVPIATGNTIKDIGEFIFMSSPRNEKQAIAAFDYAYNKLDKTKIGIIFQKNSYGTELSQKFIKEMKKMNLEPVFVEGFQDARTQSRTILAKIKDLNPEVIFIPSEYEPVATILRQAKEQKIITQFIGTDGAYSEKLIELAGDASDNFTLTMFPLDTESDFYKTFRNKYFEKHNSEPNVFTCYGYESAMTLIQTIKASENTQKAKEYLMSSEFNSFAGKVRFDNSGEAVKKYGIYRIMNNSFEIINYE